MNRYSPKVREAGCGFLLASGAVKRPSRYPASSSGACETVGMMVRNTKQRQLIQQVLREVNRPLSVDEIFAAAKTKKSSLGIATVYRNVKTLMEEGLLAAIELPGEGPRFELAGKGHHHHFRCDSCGRVYETKACLENLRRLVPRHFELTGHNLVLYGRCAGCR